MKSNFSRFLHHTMSYSGIREVFTSSLSLSDLIGESRSNKVANLSHLDYRVKPDNDSICAGRSMVEMIGVLAIIGVLSVGAIAGYSKAMFKYKLNKQTEQYNQLINAITSLKAESKLEQNTNLLSILIKLNLVPKEMIKSHNYIRDTFGNIIMIYYNNNNTVTFETNMDLQDSNQEAQDICRNIILTAKEYYKDLYYLETISDDGDRIITQYYGDNIAFINLEKADKMCRGFNGRRDAVIKIWWKF